MSNFDLLTTGKYGGIGSMIRKKGDYVIFAQPYEGSPADRAGIRIGDKILSIEGEDTKGWDPAQISSALKGTPNTTVRIVIERLIGGEHDTLTLTRERVAIPSVPYAGFVAKGSDISSTATSPKDRTKRCAPRSRNSAHRIPCGD